MKETDFVTNIFPRKISKISDGIDLLRTLEAGFLSDESILSISPFAPIKSNSEMTMMIDFFNKDDYTVFLGQIKNLGIKKIKFNYVLVTLVNSIISYDFLKLKEYLIDLLLGCE